MKRLKIITCCMLLMSENFAFAENYTPADINQAMASLLYEVEAAAGIDHNASNAITQLDEEGKQILYDSVKNKGKLIEGTYRAYDLIDKAKSSTKEPSSPTTKEPDASSQTISKTTDPYTPNYPPDYSAAYNIANVLGLTNTREDRCDGIGLEIFEDVLYAAEKAADVADAICNVAGCDPTGVGCAIACFSVETYKLAFYAAKIPIDACNKHNEGVNSAELEASFENSKGVLKDIATTISNQDDMLANQDTILINQNTIMTTLQKLSNNQDQILENQEEILLLLRTPHGRRPNWNE